MDISKIEKHIQELINTGKMKSDKDLKDVPIDEVYDKFNICPKDMLCYFCKKEGWGDCGKMECHFK
ncbi:hypothetical protein FDB39_05680 [Clostridium botulinum]|nr:hypothetical protein [Clostridium botulinum]